MPNDVEAVAVAVASAKVAVGGVPRGRGEAAVAVSGPDPEVCAFAPLAGKKWPTSRVPPAFRCNVLNAGRP
jgi:hypothetical protein